VVDTTRGGTLGGGARVTPEAHELIGLYRGWRLEVERLSEEAFRRMRGAGGAGP
jgi:molybdate transport repressor ModE-like protein